MTSASFIDYFASRLFLFCFVFFSFFHSISFFFFFFSFCLVDFSVLIKTWINSHSGKFAQLHMFGCAIEWMNSRADMHIRKKNASLYPVNGHGNSDY